MAPANTANIAFASDNRQAGLVCVFDLAGDISLIVDASAQMYRFGDWHRLLIGQTPWLFLIEVLIRAAIIYIILLIFIRLLGKRVASQLSLTELAIIVTLGAAVGVPLEIATQGILPAVAVLVVAVVFQKGLIYFGFKSRPVEVLTQGDVTTLCKDGRLLVDAMARQTLSRERLFAALRAFGIQHLGEVCRVYMESNGDFTVVREPNPVPGLTVLPVDDRALAQRAAVPEHFACSTCGYVLITGTRPSQPCKFCKCTVWMDAVAELK